mgnify:CR=1 FL=1
MIKLKEEKDCVLSAKDRYDILNFAINDAFTGEFVSSFIYERALYCYAAIILMEDSAEEIRAAISEDLIAGWDKLVKETNIIQEMSEKYDSDLALLAEEAWLWFDEYNKYVTSARGVLNFVEQFTGGATENLAGVLRDTARETGVFDVLEIADQWGMNRRNLVPERVERDWEEDKDPESLL